MVVTIFIFFNVSIKERHASLSSRIKMTNVNTLSLWNKGQYYHNMGETEDPPTKKSNLVQAMQLPVVRNQIGPMSPDL